MEDDDDIERLRVELDTLERELGIAAEAALDHELATLMAARGYRIALPNDSLSIARTRERAEVLASADAAFRGAEASCTPDTFELARKRFVDIIICSKRLERDHETAVARRDDDAATRVADERQKYDRARATFGDRLRQVGSQLQEPRRP